MLQPGVKVSVPMIEPDDLLDDNGQAGGDLQGEVHGKKETDEPDTVYKEGDRGSM